MTTRRPIITLLGHVDHGKSSILDKIRGTTVVSREAGGITQAIGCSIVPLDIIKKICGSLLGAIKSESKLPGLLFIDSPGHAAFTSLRKRGGSLADIAILVVDINEGFKPQTIESIEILKANKVPFIVAANKIDLIHGWTYDEKKLLIENINSFSYDMQGEFEKKMYELVGKFNEYGLESERFDRVQDYTKQLAIVPVSALTGQGIPELLMVLTGLAQKFLEKKLEIDETGEAKGTILEVKEEKGLGMTLDTIIYNGHLKINDTLVIGNIGEPIVVKVRTLLEPAELSDMREKKSKFKNVKEVFAATGVKISAPGLDKAISGMPVRGCSGKSEEIEILKTEVIEEVGEIITENDEDSEGVMIKADTIGGLEALKNLLQGKNIPISSSSLGDLSKKDLSKLESQKDKDEFTGVMLGFNVHIPTEIEGLAKNKGLKLINHPIIYKVIEDYEEYVEKLKKEIELRELSKLVRPCKFAVLKGYIFRQSNPAILGVEIEIGKIRSGDPVMNISGDKITQVKSIKEGQENLSFAEQGKQVAIAFEGVTVGRQIKEGDFLYTDVPEEDFIKLKNLKKHLSKIEIDVLKEIAEIKRKNNPVWGVG
ncbi:MAG: translation initiation factor IF-2 [archaeon]|nr:translation initiation factor IF-2 [Nanoarchaeota archaeon]